MTLKVCKFGGTSLATREQIEKSLDIMLADEGRKYMVVSAPGARFKGDPKITDLLIDAANKYENAEDTHSFTSESFRKIARRLSSIIPEEGEFSGELILELETELVNLARRNYLEHIKSRGEYASGRMTAEICRIKGIDAVLLTPYDIGFKILGIEEGTKPDEKCFSEMGKKLKEASNHRLVIIPGFYGHNAEGDTVTLPRGGSDTSGAVIARAVGAGIYENWTDEDGLKRADPRIVPDAEIIPELTYDEARELAYMGFKLQDACFEPIKRRGVVLNVRNTNNLSHQGTRIVDSRVVDPEERIVGVASEKDCVSINLRKLYADKEVGLGEKLLSVLRARDIPYEHTPTGVDSLSAVVRARYFDKKNPLENVVEDCKRVCMPDSLRFTRLALISATGLGMDAHLDSNFRVLRAIANAGIKDRFGDHGADDVSYTVGVDEDKTEDAVRAVYREFYP